MEALYDCFYTPPAYTERKAVVEANRALLRERIPTAERKLVLRIIDSKDLIAGARARESFSCGFWLAWCLFTQLHQYDSGRSLEKDLDGNGRFSMTNEDPSNER